MIGIHFPIGCPFPIQKIQSSLNFNLEKKQRKIKIVIEHENQEKCKGKFFITQEKKVYLFVKFILFSQLQLLQLS